MKIAVVGKGGSGKTTSASILARALGRQGHAVVALDCDTNPNLGISLGIGEDATERLLSLRDQVDDGEAAHAPTWDEMVDRFGVDAPDGVRLAVVNGLQNPEPGCPCCGLSPEQLLTSVVTGGTVIADLEAGIGTLTRLEDAVIDVVVVVVEPTPRSLEVGVRALDLARQRGIGRVIVIANRVDGEEDRTRVLDALGQIDDVVFIADDAGIREAERHGLAAMDVAPDSPAVVALVDLADRLLTPV